MSGFLCATIPGCRRCLVPGPQGGGGPWRLELGHGSMLGDHSLHEHRVIALCLLSVRC